jgi:hypothetical protein
MKIFHAVDAEVCRAVLVEIEVVEAQDNPEVSVLLAAGVSIPSTRAERLATAVKEAVRTNPGQVAAIVAPVVGALATDEKKQACAVITGALTLGSGIDNLFVVRAAGAANRFLAPTIAATAARLFPRFAAAISREAAAGAPNQRGKLHVLRRLWCRINGTFSSPLCDPQPQGWIPAMGQGIHPANYVGGPGRTTPAKGGAQPTELSEGSASIQTGPTEPDELFMPTGPAHNGQRPTSAPPPTDVSPES